MDDRSIPPTFIWRSQWFFVLAQAGFIVWVCKWYFGMVPSPGYSVAVLAVAAAIMSVHPDMQVWQKLTWMLIIGAFLVLEFHAIDKDRSDNEISQHKARADEPAAFKVIADGINTAITNNQESFAISMERMVKLGQLTKADIDESTGGNSFCYIDIREWSGLSGAVRTVLSQKGRNPVFNVNIRIVQLDNLSANIAAGTMGAIERYFNIPFVRRGGMSQVITDYQTLPNEASRSFNVFMTARNGSFTESIRLRRVAGGWSSAKIVTASYYTKVTGVVLEESDKNFPAGTLDSDKDWLGLKNVKRLSIPN
jgi:hypothetical protein